LHVAILLKNEFILMFDIYLNMFIFENQVV